MGSCSISFLICSSINADCLVGTKRCKGKQYFEYGQMNAIYFADKPSEKESHDVNLKKNLTAGIVE
jgi:hypothetical protein